MSEDPTRLRSAFVSTVGPAPPGCPSPEQIFDAALGDKPREDVDRITVHLNACRRCAEVWRRAQVLRPDPDTAEVIPLLPSPEPRPEVIDQPDVPRRPRARRSLGLLFAVLATVPALLTLSLLPTTMEPPLLGEVGPQLVTDRAERIVASGAAVELAWSGAPQGSLYTVEVRGPGTAPLVRRDGLREPRWTLPAGLTDEMPIGTELRWRVEARTPTGDRIHSREWVLRIGAFPGS